MTRAAGLAAAGLLMLAGCGPASPVSSAVATPSSAAAVVAPLPAGPVEAPPLDVHGGELLYAVGTFYWYGETYGCGFRFGVASTPWCGFVAYRSLDFQTWDGPHLLFDPTVDDWQMACRGFGCFRPKVVLNPTTGWYVLWVNVVDHYRALVSRDPLGPFTLAASPELYDQAIGDYAGRPTTLNGDESLFVDQDGSGYVAYNRGGTLVIERLTGDFLSGAGAPVAVRTYPEIAPYFGVEAPAMFVHAGTYYITVSLPRCPYCTAATGLLAARAPLGPWRFMGRLSQTSCHGQPDAVSVLPDGRYLWQTDQWLQPPDWPMTNETAARQAWSPLVWWGSLVASSPGPIACP